MYSMNYPSPLCSVSSTTSKADPSIAQKASPSGHNREEEPWTPGFHYIAGLAPLEVHCRARAAAGELCRAGKALAFWLVEIDDRRLYQQFSCSSVYHYGARYLKLAGHTVAEYLRTARKLASLPALSAAYEKGEISSAQVREITRVATPETDCSWRDAAQGRTAREIEKMVAFTPKGSFPGSCTITGKSPRAQKSMSVTEEPSLLPVTAADYPEPIDPLITAQPRDKEPPAAHLLSAPPPGAQPSRYLEKLVLEMAAEDMALLLAAFQKARRETGKSDRASLVLHMARAFLEASCPGSREAEARRAPYRIVLHHHMPSALTWCRTLKGERPVARHVLDKALCDAEVMIEESLPPEPATGAADTEVTPAESAPTGEAQVVRIGGAPSGEAPTEEACTREIPAAFERVNQLYQHIKSLKSRKAQHARSASGLAAVMPEPGEESPGHQSTRRQAKDRATTVRPRRSLPLSLRKKVLERDGWRCKAPGCDHDHYLAVHHLNPVALGGKDDEKSLVTLCTRCHDLVHQGLLTLTGD